MRKTGPAKALARIDTARLLEYRRALSAISKKFGANNQHPVEAALYSAAGKLLARASLPGRRSQLVYQILELLSWAGPPSPPMSPSEAEVAKRGLECDYFSAGMTPIEVYSTLQTVGSSGLMDLLTRKKRRGRPPIKRHLAVPAFDKWLTNPRKSWMQVTREMCNCGKSSHDLQCKDQLLQQVKDLKTVLKKYQIPIPRRGAKKSLPSHSRH